LNKNYTEEELIKKIDQLKEEMTAVGSKKGLNDAETIKHSQNLDKLLNIYQKWFK